jgi:hypothetical protein
VTLDRMRRKHVVPMKIQVKEKHFERRLLCCYTE